MRARWTARSLLLLGLLGGAGLALGETPPVPPAAALARDPGLSAPPASALFSRGERAISTGWEKTPERLHNAACATCHARAHSEWQGSGHAVAWSDDHFQRAYALEPRRWCRNCHAPLAAQESGAVPREEGVGCASCHVRDGQILGARALAAGPGAHAVAAAEGFSKPEFCGGCHQFPFPRRLNEGNAVAVEYGAAPMQDTLEEWHAANAVGCAQCHGGGHRYVGPKDLRWLSDKFGEPSLSWTAPDVVSLHVPVAARGHAMPTGDLYRSFVLEVSETSDFDHVLARHRYGREFDGHLEGSMFVAGGQSRDTRLPASATGLNLSVDAPKAGWLHLRIRYFRNDPWLHQGWTPDQSSATVVWSRRLPVAPGALRP